MKNETKYLILGLILLILALFSITFAPLVFKKFPIERYTFVQVEFFLLFFCTIFYFFSPKYYKLQITSIILGLVYYLAFIKIYPYVLL